MIDIVLQNGTGTQNGKFRVLKFFQETDSSKDRINFLKNEYGYFGTNGLNGLDGVFVEFSPSKGLTLSKSGSMSSF